ncbi:porin [Vibrio comitans]|uniref:Porin n=1 Tax=Vibrio comitans NBRC 102076 TaxID=1219078 RepID=A0A4Y3INC8_9VIBR|nr:porin [Vibrio comitans]GEA60592.1 porin [Vibrio comitans NBRC 102076]
MLKRTLGTSALILILTSPVFASNYLTGNLQFHDDGRIHGSKVTSTIETGYTKNNGFGNLTLYAEFAGIQLGDIVSDDGGVGQQSAFVTVGGEHSINITNNLWVAAGYQHFFSAGETLQYRPLVKVGYNFDNGFSLSNRSRAHIGSGDRRTDYRLDNRIAYEFNDIDLRLSYNNVYMIEAESMDHEFRAAWTRGGVQPYIEFRTQAHGLENSVGDSLVNNALLLGAFYRF